jgi:hypothetical protein
VKASLKRSADLFHGIRVVASFLGIAAAGVRVDAQTTSVAWPDRQIGLTVAMYHPSDVNQRPDCEELHVPCSSPRTFPDFGVGASYAGRVRGPVQAAVELNMYSNQWIPPHDSAVAGRARANKVYAMMFGGRLTGPSIETDSRDTRAWRAFAQILIGPEWSDEVPMRVAVQPGVGVEMQLKNSTTTLQAAIDYRATGGSGRNLSTPRSSFGIVYGVGR